MKLCTTRDECCVLKIQWTGLGVPWKQLLMGSADHGAGRARWPRDLGTGYRAHEMSWCWEDKQSCQKQSAPWRYHALQGIPKLATMLFCRQVGQIAARRSMLLSQTMRVMAARPCATERRLVRGPIAWEARSQIGCKRIGLKFR